MHRPGISVGALLGSVTSKQTYKSLLYLVLSFPLGMFYWTILLLGFVFGLVLSVVVVGLGILLATLVGVRAIGQFERRLANSLLAVDLADPADVSSEESLSETFKGYLDAPSTWRYAGFVSLKLWVGIAGLVVFVLIWSVLELLTAPVRYPYTVEFGQVNDQPVTWSIETLPEAIGAVPVAVVGGIVLLQVSNGVAYVAQQIASSLLGAGD